MSHEKFTTYTRNYEKGEIIFNEGNRCDGLYLIQRGRVKIFKRLYRNGKNEELTLATLRENKIFGEMALLSPDGKRTASARAEIKTQCLLISGHVFDKHLDELPPWMKTIIQNLVQRLDCANRTVKDLLEDGRNS